MYMEIKNMWKVDRFWGIWVDVSNNDQFLIATTEHEWIHHLLEQSYQSKSRQIVGQNLSDVYEASCE